MTLLSSPNGRTFIRFLEKTSIAKDCLTVSFCKTVGEISCQMCVKMFRQLRSFSETCVSTRSKSVGTLSAFGLSEEQTKLHANASYFALKQLKPWTRAEDKESLRQRMIQKAADAGLGGLLVSPINGGSGLQPLNTSLVFEALGRGCTETSTCLISHNVASWIIDAFGDNYQRNQWVAKLARLGRSAAFSFSNPRLDSEADESSPSNLKFEKVGSSFVLNGSKEFCSINDICDVYLVVCQSNNTSKDFSCFLVPKESPGLSIEKTGNSDAWKLSRTLIFEDCKLHGSCLIGAEGKGLDIATGALLRSHLPLTSVSLGAAYESLKRLHDQVLKQDQQQQHPDKLHHLQCRMAELSSHLLAARLLIRNAAKALEWHHYEASSLACMARLFGSEACFKVFDESLQLQASFGLISDECLNQHFQDLRSLQIPERTSGQLLQMIISQAVDLPDPLQTTSSFYGLV